MTESANANHADLLIEQHGHVRMVRISRPPFNFIDPDLVSALADELERADADAQTRCVVLAAEGRVFCAGANIPSPPESQPSGSAGESPFARELYRQAARLFRTAKPIVAAVQGAAVGGGLGLAMVADFRVTSPQASFSANFTRLGFHAGFALSFTLPSAVGATNAGLLLYTGRKVAGDEAVRLGIASVLVPRSEAVLAAAMEMANEIARAAPLAVAATRATLRAGWAEQAEAAMRHELQQQTVLRQTDDFREGIAASKDRRPPSFAGR